MTTVAGTIDVNFPPSHHPRDRKLVIRNTCTAVIIAKVKLVGASPTRNITAAIPPGEFQTVMLFMLPKDYSEDFNLGDDAPPMYLVLKENDQVEIHCRTLSNNGASDLIKKVRVKVQLPGQDKGLTRISYNYLQPNANELSKLGKKEQHAWWMEKICKYLMENSERREELYKWRESTIDHPETCAYTLRMIVNAKRFSAPSYVVEIPGKVSLIESIPYPVENFNDPDCITARSISYGTSTAMPIKAKQLLKLTPSDSECGTARAMSGATACEWISSWINWFLPVKVAG